MSERTRTLVNSTLKFLFAAGIITWLVATGRFEVRAALALFQSPLFFAGALLIGLNLFLTSERWRWLVTPHDVNVTAGGVFRLTLIGTFFNYVMPGGVGGDVVKAYYFGKDHPSARAAAITSVILDRALGLYAMVCMAVFVMLADYERVLSVQALKTLLTLMLAVWVAFSAAFYVLFSRRLKRAGWIISLLSKLPFSEKFLKLYETGHKFGLLRRRMIAILALSVLSQSVSIVFLWVAGRAAGFADIPLITYFLVAPLGYMAAAIPVSPAGLGVGQAAFHLLFNVYLGHESGVGSAVITTQQVMTALFGLAGAWFYIQRRDPVPEALGEQT